MKLTINARQFTSNVSKVNLVDAGHTFPEMYDFFHAIESLG